MRQDFIFQGRVPESDEDILFIHTADSYDEAYRAFVECLTGDLDEETLQWKKDNFGTDDGVYVTNWATGPANTVLWESKQPETV